MLALKLNLVPYFEFNIHHNLILIAMIDIVIWLVNKYSFRKL